MQDTPFEKLDKKHFVKGWRGSVPNRGAATSKEVDNSKEIALRKAKMNKLCDLLDEVSFGANVPCFSSILLFSITLRFTFLLAHQIFLYVLIVCIWILTAYVSLNNSFFLSVFVFRWWLDNWFFCDPAQITVLASPFMFLCIYPMFWTRIFSSRYRRQPDATT